MQSSLLIALPPDASPFVASAWQDDASALDYPTTHAWTMLMRLFVAEYLELDLGMHSSSSKREPQNEDDGDGWGDDSWLREERKKRQRETERDELVSCS